MKKVIIYEGLFGRVLGSQMTKAFKKAMPGHPCETRSWTNKEPIPKGAVVLGHSFGAYRAWELFHNDSHSHLIIVDFRTSSTKSNKDYTFFAFKNTYNFFQKNSFPGFRLRGDVQNTPLNMKGLFAHMRAPHHPLVIAKIQEVMRNDESL